ncbi:MAG: hypothetical protein JSS86_21185, partial [Cyanobacteria bacterium SZAS LIN-2]|nr:hypothetical protein [Cyanobacteria bacterium SZAS LIN-2]
FEAVGRLASAFLQYAAEFGEEERSKAEVAIVRQLVNIQSGYPAFFKFSDSDKAVVVQSPCDGLAKAIQNYRNNHSAGREELIAQEEALNHGTVPVAATAPANYATTSSTSLPQLSVTVLPQNSTGLGRTQPACGKCGGEAWLKIDGCNVCQSCGYSKCG